LVVVSKDI